MPVVRNSRGDTLIEVTIALAILSITLMAATRLAIRAFQQGQTARERTVVSMTVQQQIEQLRNFRDNHTWDEFLYGNGSFDGVLTAHQLAGCRGPARCFYLRQTPSGYVPVAGTAASVVPESYVEFVAAPNDIGNPTTVSFRVSWGFRDVGGGPDNTNHLVTELTRLK